MELRHTTRNKAAIQLVIEAIKSNEPEQFIMSQYFSFTHRSKKGAAPCKTAACIAGWTCLTHNLGEIAVPYKAGKCLGLTNLVTYKLFTMGGIEKGLRYVCEKHKISGDILVLSEMEFFDELPAKVRKQAAINVLTHFHDTGEVDWPMAIDLALSANS